VELQSNLSTLQKNGIQPYAISYDPVDTLHAFAAQHGITYPLLADVHSEVIRAFDIFNDLVPKGHRWYGVPFPGTYMVNADGIVIDKSFYANHGVRDSVANMLQENFHLTPAGRPAHTLETEDLKATARLSSSTIRRGQVQTFTLDIEIKKGRHIYSPNITGGYTPTKVLFDSIEDLQIDEVTYPAAELISILNEDVAVYTARLTLKATLRSRCQENVTVRAHLDYQACDERECYLPQQLTFELPLTYLDNI